MSYISLLGQYSSCDVNVVDSGQYIIYIKGLPINVAGGSLPEHCSLPYHNPILTNYKQSFVTINNKPIFLIGDSAACGATLIPDPNKKPPKPLQEFISIS